MWHNRLVSSFNADETSRPEFTISNIFRACALFRWHFEEMKLLTFQISPALKWIAINKQEKKTNGWDARTHEDEDAHKTLTTESSVVMMQFITYMCVTKAQLIMYFLRRLFILWAYLQWFCPLARMLQR